MSRPWVLLHNGEPYDFVGDGGRIDILTLASQLAKINRFCGATLEPYSVAQHSVHVADIAQRRGCHAETCMLALLHDAHEIITSDIPSPVGRELGGLARIQAEAQFRIERDLLGDDLHRRVIGRQGRFGDSIAHARKDMVHRCDLIALATEKQQLLVPGRRNWEMDLPEPDKITLIPVSWQKARDGFIARYCKILAELKVPA